MGFRRFIWRKEWLFNIPTLLWWFIWELAKDSIMEAARDFLARQGILVSLAKYLLEHPGIIALVVFVGIAIYVAIKYRKEDDSDRSSQAQQIAKLELSDPMIVPRHPETVMHDGIYPWHVEVDLWRISLTNTQPNSQAFNVSIQVTNSEPAISMLPVILHERNDSTQPFKRSWPLRAGETLVFDVIGFQTLGIDRGSGRPIGLFYLYRSDGDNSVIPCKIPEKEMAGAMQKGGVVLTIAVFADLPTMGITGRYRAFIDKQNRFALETYSKTRTR